MADPMSAAAIAQVGIQGGQAVSSGIKGNKAANKANESAATQQGYIDQLAGFGGQGINTILDQLSGVTQTGNQYRDQIYQDTQTAAGNLNDIYGQAGATLSGQSDLLNQAAGMFGNSSTIDDALARYGGFQTVDIANQLNPDAGRLANMEFGVDPLSGDYAGNQFDFGGVEQLQGQAIAAGQEAAGRARQGAKDNAAQSIQQGSQALNAQLASRGISGNSGVAGGALSQMLSQATQQQVGLENSLADQAANTALQFGQFDVQSGMQLAGMQAQDNQFFNQLGFQQDSTNAQLGLQGQQMQSQYNQAQAGNALAGQNMLAGALGQEAQLQSFLNQAIGNLAGQAGQQEISRANGLSGIQGQMDERLINGTTLSAAGQTAGLDLQQQNYNNNYLNPQMNLLNMLAPGGMLATALSGQGGITEMLGNNASAGGAGKGAATAGATAGAGQLAGNKGATTAGAGVPAGQAPTNPVLRTPFV